MNRSGSVSKVVKLLISGNQNLHDLLTTVDSRSKMDKKFRLFIALQARAMWLLSRDDLNTKSLSREARQDIDEFGGLDAGREMSGVKLSGRISHSSGNGKSEFFAGIVSVTGLSHAAAKGFDAIMFLEKGRPTGITDYQRLGQLNHATVLYPDTTLSLKFIFVDEQKYTKDTLAKLFHNLATNNRNLNFDKGRIGSLVKKGPKSGSFGRDSMDVTIRDVSDAGEISALDLFGELVKLAAKNNQYSLQTRRDLVDCLQDVDLKTSSPERELSETGSVKRLTSKFEKRPETSKPSIHPPRSISASSGYGSERILPIQPIRPPHIETLKQRNQSPADGLIPQISAQQKSDFSNTGSVSRRTAQFEKLSQVSERLRNPRSPKNSAYGADRFSPIEQSRQSHPSRTSRFTHTMSPSSMRSNVFTLTFSDRSGDLFSA
eukprot:195839_1